VNFKLGLINNNAKTEESEVLLRLVSGQNTKRRCEIRWVDVHRYLDLLDFVASCGAT